MLTFFLEQDHSILLFSLLFYLIGSHESCDIHPQYGKYQEFFITNRFCSKDVRQDIDFFF